MRYYLIQISIRLSNIAEMEELMARCDRLVASFITTQTESKSLLESTLREALALSI